MTALLYIFGTIFLLALIGGWLGVLFMIPLRRQLIVEEHGVLVNPLAYDGYPSIGCAPCTHRVAAGQDPRSGRWSGSAKTECGLHV